MRKMLQENVQDSFHWSGSLRSIAGLSQELLSVTRFCFKDIIYRSFMFWTVIVFRFLRLLRTKR